MSHCTPTCIVAFIIVVAMIIMTFMTSNDSFIKSYRDGLPDDLKAAHDEIVDERLRIYFTGYLIGFVLSVFIIIFNVNVLKQKMPVAAMVCLAVVVSTITNYFYYILSPKSNYMVELLKTDKQRQDWLQVYKSMQYYYHSSFVLGAVAVGVFAYAFRGTCR
jgi:Ca2+/Na+ antiporter